MTCLRYVVRSDSLEACEGHELRTKVRLGQLYF